MKRVTVGLVDYGVGNHASISHALYDAGFRVRVGRDADLLDACDLLLLPGVGAFPSAMERLVRYGLVDYLQDAAAADRPILGICLGMQLLAHESLEHGRTAGLGLIPGRVIPLGESAWHIGWNALECTQQDPTFTPSHGEWFYFNHSFVFAEAEAYRACIARAPLPITAAVRKDRIVGLQFHPEKSQAAGMRLLRNVIDGLVNA